MSKHFTGTVNLSTCVTKKQQQKKSCPKYMCIGAYASFTEHFVDSATVLLKPLTAAVAPFFTCTTQKAVLLFFLQTYKHFPDNFFVEK